MDGKEAAARKALERIQDGMKLGLGTGSTSVYFIRALGERVRQEGLRVQGVPTSQRSADIAQEFGIPLIDLSEAGELDIAVDGADEVDLALSLIKGGGGALLRERLVEAAAREFIVVCDSTKVKETLGAFPLPVVVVPFGWKTTCRRLERYGKEIVLRPSKDNPNRPYLTDDGLYILDMHFGRIENPPVVAQEIKQTTGVVEVGLFVGMAARLVIGYPDGHTEERLPAR